MKREGQYAFGAMTLSVVFASMSLAAERPSYATPPSVARLSEVLSVPLARARAASMRVEVRDWQLAGPAKAFQIPVQGFYVVQLRSGAVVTEIAGKSETRKAGDFWTVGAGVSMTVTFARRGQAAQLLTMAVNPNH